MTNEEKTRKLKVNGQVVVVTNEVYKEYMRPQWREEQRKYRSWRCRDGKGIRCKKRCDECPYYRIGNGPRGSDVSIEGLMDEENGTFDIPDLMTDVEVEVARNILHSDLHKARMSLNDRERELFDMLLDERSDTEIAAALHVTKSGAREARYRLFTKLKELLKDFEDYLY